MSLLPAAGVLPFALLGGVTLLLRRAGHRWPESVVAGIIAWAIICFASAEILGSLHGLSRRNVTVLWTVLSCIVAGMLIITRGSSAQPHQFERQNTPMLLWIITYCIVTGFIAVTSAPVNFDSQTYHLPRIEHWIQNQTLDHYPTSIGRQIWMPPLAEILILHTRLLSGVDWYAQLVQWIAMVGSVFGIYSLAEKLGASEPQRLFACLFVITLPMGILQSTSTQSDYLVTFFLVAFTNGVFAFREKLSATAWLLAGVAFSLAALAKPTAYLIAVGFGIWFLLIIGTRVSIHRAATIVLMSALIFASVNVWPMVRNIATYGSLFGPLANLTNNASWGNASWGLAQTIDNAVLNAAVHLSTGFRPVDEFSTEKIAALTEAIGVSTHREETILAGQAFRIPTQELVRHMDFAPNPVHFLLLAFALITLAVDRKRVRSAVEGRYVLCLILGALVFVSVLRWNPWISRYHLPMFILAAPIVALTLERMRSRHLGILITHLLPISSLLVLLVSNSHPLIKAPAFGSSLFSNGKVQNSYLTQSRAEQILPQMRVPYENITDFIVERGYRNIGLLLGDDNWEYPLWFLLRQKAGGTPVRIEHVFVRDGSLGGYFSDGSARAVYPLGSFSPEVLVVTPQAKVGLGETLDLTSIGGGLWWCAIESPEASAYVRVIPVNN